MTTVTVDLPARNVWLQNPGAGTPATQTGGTDCLADTDPSTGVSLSASTAGFYVGALENPLFPGYATSSGDALGFGLFDLPAAATLVDIRFVADMDGSRVGAVPPGSYSGSAIDPIPAYYPTLAADYIHAPTTLGYALDAPATAAEVVGSAVTHLIGGSDYVIAGIGTPDTGTFGLCPLVTIADPWWQFPVENHPIFVSYLALRITYTVLAAPPPLRRYPRSDGMGIGPTRHYPPAPSRRAAGGYR